MSILLPEHTDQAVANVIENTAKPLSTNIGNTLADLWFLVFGGIPNMAKRKKIRYDVELEKFKEEVEQKYKNIPEEDLKEPDTQIAGQALEKSKYCVENATLRSMFASLIASSMMTSKEGIVHPSFAEIITQMSPDDANAFIWLSHHNYWSAISFMAYFNDAKDGYHLFKNIWRSCDSIEELTKCELISDSLLRLGLIEISYSEYLGGKNILNDYEKHISELLYDYILEHGDFDTNHTKDQCDIVFRKGTVKLTNLGAHFLECVR